MSLTLRQARKELLHAQERLATAREFYPAHVPARAAEYCFTLDMLWGVQHRCALLQSPLQRALGMEAAEHFAEYVRLTADLNLR